MELDDKPQALLRDGFVHLRGVIKPVDGVDGLLRTVAATANGLDGAKWVSADDPAARQLQEQVNAIAGRAADLAGLRCGPVIEMQKKVPWLIRKLWLDETQAPTITTITMTPGHGMGPL
eukprot:7340252-Prymnesium_polylepis.1